jgi:hypothetical protein
MKRDNPKTRQLMIGLHTARCQRVTDDGQRCGAPAVGYDRELRSYVCSRHNRPTPTEPPR